MRMGTLVAGVLAMAAGFGIAALGIGWPALVVGGPLVFGGLVVAAVTYINGMQQHARQYRYAQVAQQQWAAAMPAWDGYGDSARDDRPPWREYRPLQDEDTLDSEEMAALIAGLPAELGLPRPDTDRTLGNSPADSGSDVNGSEISSPADSD
jgi:hypothetical protein